MATVTGAKRRRPVYYGWYVIGVLTVAAFAGTGTSQLTLGLMLKPMSEDFGWSRTAATGAITLGTFGAGLLGPLFGRLADRYGPRWLATFGVAVGAASCAAFVNMSQLWQFYVAFLIGRCTTANAPTGVVAMTAATNWFRRMRGRALGLVAMSIPLTNAVAVFSGQLIMDSYGWRTVYVFFAAVSALLLLPCILVLRRRPEDLGLLPDGAEPGEASPSPGGRKPRGEEVSWSLSEAIRTPSLWLLTGAISVAVMANTALAFHQVAYFTDVGIAATAAGIALSVYGLCGGLANVVWGFLTERFSERVLAVGAMLMAASVILYLLSVRTIAGALVFSVMLGLTSRGGGTLVNIILAQYYGRNSYGTISGFVSPFQMAGLGLGPFLASVLFDVSGSYTAVIFTFSGACVLCAALLWLAKKPARPAGALA